MIKVEPILDIIETALWTGGLADEKPLSVILIASVGDGKSEMLRKSYRAPKINVKWKDTKDKDGNPSKERSQTVKHLGSVLYTTDTTPYVLHHRYGELLASGQIRHIVIPDFLSILTKSKDAMPDTVRFYNCLIEEGILRIESRYSDFITEKPVQIGLLTAVSKQDYDARSQTQNWGNFGFLSRVLPVSYSYAKKTKIDILRSVFLREYHNETSFDLKLPNPQVEVEIPAKYSLDTIRLAWAVKDPNDELGARRLKQIMTFLMAIALKDGRDVVNDNDVARLKTYSAYFNSECKMEL